jgi:hypothetical protein
MSIAGICLAASALQSRKSVFKKPNASPHRRIAASSPRLTASSPDRLNQAHGVDFETRLTPALRRHPVV